jgi:hypothetical protein
MIEVEEIALGPVLRKLNVMPGIAKLHLDLGRGGEGAGRKPLEDHATRSMQNGPKEPIAIKLLMQGPTHISAISAALGGPKSRAYGLTNTMSKKGIVERADGAGMWKLTKKAMTQLGKAMPNVTPVAAAVPALPAPGGIRRSPSGRAAQGSGPIILRSVLGNGPTHPSDLRKQLAERGMSTKSISGVVDRAKKHGLIKKNGSELYELTAKGLKIELGASAHG